MVPPKKVFKTTYELWHGKVTSTSYLKIWDCDAYVKRETSNNLDLRSQKCIFVVHPKEAIAITSIMKMNLCCIK